MPATPASVLGLIAQYAPLANGVSRHFDTRPGLRNVAREMLLQALQTHKVVPAPRGAKYALTWQSPSGASASVPLEDLLIQRYLQGRTLNLIAGHDAVTVHTDTEAPRPSAVSIDSLEALIEEWGPQVVECYKRALVSYWNTVEPGGSSRWRWLAGHLRGHVLAVARRLAEQGRLDEPASETLLGVCSGQPPAGTRCALLQIERSDNPALATPQITSEVVITPATPGALPAQAEQLLLCRPLGEVQAFADRAALASAQADALGAALTGAHVTFSQVPVTGDIFEAQALILLEHQLSDVTALAEHYREQTDDIDAFEGLLERATSLGDLSQPAELRQADQLSRVLPGWLESAARSDRVVYAASLARLGEVQRQSGGRHYLDDILPIEDYAAAELTRQIALDHPSAPVALADVEVRIYQAPDALLQIAQGGDAHLEYVVLSLASLALLNLHGRPSGMLEIEPRAGASLPAWVTREAVLTLVQRVDIGRRYVAHLRSLLLEDPAQAPGRQHLFIEQLRVQLPLKMLELKIRQACGVTVAGLNTLLRALGLAPMGGPYRGADSAEAPVTVRQLALRRAPGARPDIVHCAYLIGPADDHQGVCVLYRPLAREPLQQYPSAHALRVAIAAPGPLQDDILLWLDAAARPVYAKGGFDEPHIRHFLPGDDAAPIWRPAPATLTGVALPGELWQTLYRQNVTGLQAIADRQSVSNEESRWLGYREFGWVVFNALLPLVGGPLASAGWMLQSLKLFDDGFQGQLKGDPQAANTALTEFFFNAAFVLLGQSLETRSRGVDRVTRPRLEAGEWIDPVKAPAAPAALVSSHLAALDNTAATLHQLEFGFQSASHRLSPAQQSALASFAVPARDFGLPVPHGPTQGLYLLENHLLENHLPENHLSENHLPERQWYALIDSHWFALTLEEGAPRIVDLTESTRRGPLLLRDEAGRWRIDTGLRLAGGSPGRGRKAYKEAQQQREAALLKTVGDYRDKQSLIDRKLRVTQAVMADLQVQGSRQYPAYRQRFIDLAGELVQASGEAIDAFAELNKIKPQPRFLEERAGHLRALLRIKWEIVSKLREQMSELILGDGLGHETPVADPMTSFAEFATGCGLIDQLIHWTGQAQERMQGLAAIEHFGALELAAIKPTWAAFGTPLTWRGVQLYWLAVLSEQKLLAYPRAEGPLSEAVASAKLAAQSHNALLEPGLFTDEEQIQVLDSALQRYEELEDALDFTLATVEPNRLSPAVPRMLIHLSALRGAAESQLLPLFRQQTLRARQQRKQQRPSRQQVIVTSRKRGVLVGRMQVRTDGGAQRFEVAGGLDDTTPEQFQQVAGGDDWERVPSAGKSPAPLATAPLETSMREAMALLAQAERQWHQATARVKASKAHIPSETQNLLDGIAQGLRDKADDIDRALVQSNQTDRLSASTGQSADITVKLLRDKAQWLKREGRRLRVELCKANDPQASRVQWLVDEGEARIELSGPRTRLKAGDFLQEYAIADSAGVLWYAHFHYPALATAAEHFTVAHLKTVAQRYLTDKVFMALGETVKGAKGLIRAEIQPNMARKLYLPVGVKQSP